MKRNIDSNAWVREVPASEFENRIREVFDFLRRELSFSSPVIEKSSLTLRLSYRARRVAVELCVDFRDLEVEVALVWMIDGKRPEGWAVDLAGRRFMVRIYEAARHRRVPNPKVAIPPGAAPHTTLQLWLEAWAEQLRVQFADILNDDDTFFRELNQGKQS